MTGIVIYLIGILIQVPFLSTAFYTGPLVETLGGVDISWIVGLLVPEFLYYAFGRGTLLRAPPQMILPICQWGGRIFRKKYLCNYTVICVFEILLYKVR